MRAIWVLVLWVKTAQVPCEPMIASNFIETDPEAERWTIDIAVWEKAQKVAREKVFKAATCLGWAVQIFQQVGIMLPDHGPGTGTTWWGRTPLPIKSGNVYRHSRLLLNYCPHSYNLLKAWPLLKRSVGPTQFSISARSSQGNIYIYIYKVYLQLKLCSKPPDHLSSKKKSIEFSSHTNYLGSYRKLPYHHLINCETMRSPIS